MEEHGGAGWLRHFPQNRDCVALFRASESEKVGKACVPSLPSSIPSLSSLRALQWCAFHPLTPSRTQYQHFLRARRCRP